MSQTLGITMGDPAGIGPEILYRAWQKIKHKLKRPFVIFGVPDAYSKLNIDVEEEFLSCIEGPSDICDYQIGLEGTVSGELAYAFLEMSVQAVINKRIYAILNAPISKKAIALTQPGFLGHTQYYEKVLGRGPALMSFYGSEFCLCLLTHHVPLNEASRDFMSLDLKELLLRGIQGFKKILGRDIRVGVSGFNPHAGEGGLLSRGEEALLQEAILDLKQQGFMIEGPIAADSLFIPRIRKQFDLIFACHHDQGLIPFKAAHAPYGLSLTFGLEVLRATVDHGTAFDIAGRGVASCESMIEAWELMDRICL